MNSINLYSNSAKKIANSFSPIISHSCYNSLKSLNNNIIIPKSSISTITHNNVFSYINTTSPTVQITSSFSTNLKFYSTNNNQDSCNIQNACTTGIESNNNVSTENSFSKKFNNSETPFDIRHEGALTPMEKLLLNKLVKAFEPTAIIKVKDISDGCGTLYMVDVTSTKFDNLLMVKQHRIVMDILKEELKTWHGIHIVTHPVHKRKRRNKKKK